MWYQTTGILTPGCLVKQSSTAHISCLNRLSVSFKEGDEFKANLLYKVGVKEMTLTGKKGR